MDPSNTGAAVVSIPIEVPPGRAGISPNLALSYNSSGGYGWVGMGWTLEPGAIQRSTKNGVDYSGTDFIFLKDDASQDLVARGDWGTNYYGNAIEGAFTKYYYNTSTGGWEVTTKDGLKYYYGSTTASRQNNPWTTDTSCNPIGSTQVFKWFLDRVQDLDGNYVTFAYGCNKGGTYLKEIDYTGNTAGLSTTNKLTFSLSGDGAFPNKIDVYASGQYVRGYGFSNSISPVTGHNLLSAITRYGSDGVSTLPPITFSYQAGSGEFAYLSPVSAPVIGPSSAAGDFDGDGTADIADSSNVTSTNSTSVYFSQGGSGFSQPVALSTAFRGAR